MSYGTHNKRLPPHAISQVWSLDDLATLNFLFSHAQSILYILYPIKKNMLIDIMHFTSPDNLRENGKHPHSCLK